MAKKSLRPWVDMGWNVLSPICTMIARLSRKLTENSFLMARGDPTAAGNLSFDVQIMVGAEADCD